MQILVVDDDLDLLEELTHVLQQEKYKVDTAADGEQALDKLFEHSYDIVLLDIMLPKIDGLTVLKEMRRNQIQSPVLMLTAKGDVDDRIKGLDSGADDYLAKPFDMAELMARIRAVLRRGGENKDINLTVDTIILNTKTRKVIKDGELLELTPKEFSILEFLLYNKNRIVSRYSLAEHVWGDEFDPFTMSNFIDVHIKNLRKKIGDTKKKKIIRTVRGVGFIIGDDQE
jgi:DNA-binding response OmpR family regulator